MRPGHHQDLGPGWGADGRVAVQCLCGRDIVHQLIDDYEARVDPVCGPDCVRVPALSRERQAS
jgi:hypothetical protein